MKFKSVAILQFPAVLISALVGLSAHAADRNVYAASSLAEKVIVERTRMLTAPDLQLSALASEAEACGLGFQGPLCLDSAFQPAGTGQAANLETSDSFLFFSVFKDKNSDRHFSLIVEVAKEDSILSQSQVFLVSYGHPVSAEQAKNDFLLGRTQKAIEVYSPADAPDFAVKGLTQTQDPRVLFHLAEYLVQNTSNHLPLVAAELSRGYFLVTRQASQPYQLAFLRLIRSHFSGQLELALYVALDLLNSSNTDISQLAAITLAERGATDQAVKDKVIAALSSPKWEYRRLGVLALNTTKNSSADSNLLLGMLLDSDNDVRVAAVSAVNSLLLGNENLDTLVRLSRSPDWSRRREGLQLINRVRTPEATALILERFDDSDLDVQNAAVSFMNARGIGEREIPQLIQLSFSQNSATRALMAKNLARFHTESALSQLIRLSNDNAWDVRREAVVGINQNPSGQATIALIAKLSDTDSDVSSVAKSGVNSRILSNNELPSFRLSLKSPSWDVRRSAILYIGRINSPESTAALIPMILDSDQDVRSAAMTILDSRTLGDAEVSILATYITHNNEDGRRNVVKYLGRSMSDSAIALLVQMAGDASWSLRLDVVRSLAKSQAPNASTALIDRLKDSDGDVSSAARTALQGRALLDSHVAQFGKLLNDSNWDTRRYAATFLGAINSPLVLGMLIDRLVIETDGDVQSAIRAAIQAVRARR